MHLSKYKLFFLIIFTALFVCCSPIVFKPTVEDADLAKTKWSDASMEQLNSGFKIYVAKCGGCHLLHTPTEFSEKQWLEILPEMGEKSKLDHVDYDLVLKYVITKSYTQIKKK